MPCSCGQPTAQNARLGHLSLSGPSTHMPVCVQQQPLNRCLALPPPHVSAARSESERPQEGRDLPLDCCRPQRSWLWRRDSAPHPFPAPLCPVSPACVPLHAGLACCAWAAMRHQTGWGRGWGRALAPRCVCHLCAVGMPRVAQAWCPHRCGSGRTVHLSWEAVHLRGLEASDRLRRFT